MGPRSDPCSAQLVRWPEQISPRTPVSLCVNEVQAGRSIPAWTVCDFAVLGLTLQSPGSPPLPPLLSQPQNRCSSFWFQHRP